MSDPIGNSERNPGQSPEHGSEPEMGGAREGLKKFAFVAVVGRPSVGKSTLVNALCHAKVAIVSPVPQTTRNAIRGILNRDEGQLVFIDTPGQHLSDKKFNRKLIDVAGRAVVESELALYVLDATRKPGPEEEAVLQRLQGRVSRLVVGINKCDLPGADPAMVQSFIQSHLPTLPLDRCYSISALQGQNIESLIQGLYAMADPGDPAYPEEYYTDQELSFRIAEIIREKAINRLRQELPHAIYVEVADTELREEGTRLWIRAFIVAERESQKGIIVGKGGSMIKAIREAAQKDLNRILDWKVELDLRVKARGDWRSRDGLLQKLIN